MEQKQRIFDSIRGGLIVSCQALESEPMHSSYIMSRMAVSAQLGGAVGIRANSLRDIQEIRKLVHLPMIGIIKQVYPGSSVFISPTEEEVTALVAAGVELVAMDATARPRPLGCTLESFFPRLRERFPGTVFMADCSCFEDAARAKALGFDCVGTTLCGYTEETKGTALPNLELIRRLARELGLPVIAEGGIWTAEQLVLTLESGAWAAVVGTAITRPREITRRMVHALESATKQGEK